MSHRLHRTQNGWIWVNPDNIVTSKDGSTWLREDHIGFCIGFASLHDFANHFSKPPIEKLAKHFQSSKLQLPREKDGKFKKATK